MFDDRARMPYMSIPHTTSRTRTTRDHNARTPPRATRDQHTAPYDQPTRPTFYCRPSQYQRAYAAMIPFLHTRESQICQEFAFFPTAPPHTEGGVFELRRYQLKSGALLEWEMAWCAFVYPDRSMAFVLTLKR